MAEVGGSRKLLLRPMLTKSTNQNTRSLRIWVMWRWLCGIVCQCAIIMCYNRFNHHMRHSLRSMVACLKRELTDEAYLITAGMEKLQDWVCRCPVSKIRTRVYTAGFTQFIYFSFNFPFLERGVCK